MTFSFEQVAMIIGGIFALAGAAWAFNRYIDTRFDKRDEDRKVERQQDQKNVDAKLDLQRDQNAQSLEAVMRRLDDDREIAQKAFQLFHDRISKAKDETVQLTHYDKDLSRLEKSNQQILDAIEKLASSTRHKMDTLAQTINTQVGLREHQAGEIKNLHEQQKVIIGLLAPPKHAAE